MLLLCAHSPAWLHPKCNSHELLSLLFYLRDIPRFEGETWNGEGRVLRLDHEVLCSVDWVLRQSSPFRPEVQALGLTVLVDARICSPSSSLTWGLSQLQVSREDCGSLLLCFLYGQGMGLNFDSLQEASPGSVQLLLVGRMPEDLPMGLQVPSQAGAGEDGRRWRWGCLCPIFLHHGAFFCSSSSCLPIRAC